MNRIQKKTPIFVNIDTVLTHPKLNELNNDQRNLLIILLDKILKNVNIVTYQIFIKGFGFAGKQILLQLKKHNVIFNVTIFIDPPENARSSDQAAVPFMINIKQSDGGQDEFETIVNTIMESINGSYEERQTYLSLTEGCQDDTGHIAYYLLNELVMRSVCLFMDTPFFGSLSMNPSFAKILITLK